MEIDFEINGKRYKFCICDPKLNELFPNPTIKIVHWRKGTIYHSYKFLEGNKILWGLDGQNGHFDKDVMIYCDKLMKLKAFW
jgi:hypothetical protein